MDIEKIRFINGYHPKEGGILEKRRLYEKVLDEEICNSFNRGGMSTNKEILTEALIATYDIFKVKEIFERKYSDIEFKVVKQANNIYVNYCAIIFVPQKLFTRILKGEIIAFMKFCGFLYQPNDKYEGNGYVRMVFKPMFQTDDCTEEVRAKCKYIYHLTDKQNLADIQKRGLIPSSQNMYFNYPDRVYFVLENNISQKGFELLKAIREIHGNKSSVVLMFDVEKIPDNVTFHTDFDAEESIFTHDNIPPSAIAGMMDWQNFEKLK